MAPDGSPLVVLAQQGAEAANLVAAEKSASVLQREPSAGDNTTNIYLDQGPNGCNDP
jgi:hypothetical protein